VKLNSEWWEVGGHRAIATGRLSLTGKRCFPGNTAFSNAFWGIAVLAAVGIVGAASPTEAAPSVFWPDYYEPASQPRFAPKPRFAPPRMRKSTRHRAPKTEEVANDTRKPQGPLIIVISIEKQVLKIYDANGYFAESPVSTGMRGHSTPMGVFSIIEKHKMHHSNIYSGAPMPYMQRITWSGVAMHAGVLPGYPASHGCIRMPMSFAMKMWNWTKMGARVVVTPGELTPERFSHPLLATQKVIPTPAPIAAMEPRTDVVVTAKSDKAAIADVTDTPFSAASLELKSTVGHDLAKSGAGQTHTADASSALSRPGSPVTVSDATSSTAGPAAKADGNASETSVATVDKESTTPATDGIATNSEAKTNDALSAEPKPETAEAGVKGVEVAASEDKTGNTKSVEEASSATKSSEVQTAETAASGKAEAKSAFAGSPAQSTDEAAKAEIAKPEAAEVETAGIAAVNADAAKPDLPKAIDRPEEQTKEQARPAADAGATLPDVKKDQARPSDPEKAAAKPAPAVAAAPKPAGQIAVFVSKKDGKLYVRQNFKPLFDVPVTITPGERPLGTHIFTAQTDRDDANLLHWSVVSMPMLARNASPYDEDERVSRRRRTTGAIEVKPAPVPDSATEALNRLTIPEDAMTRITEAFSTGGSIIVSDQGITAGETGLGTDFIIRLR
jgi:lipoprotein-anchoring transpeptidase ErfK/SrfK